jgi:hypothetical protein
MAFSPISLPIQEILLTNFVTDIATISNANDLVLQDKLEDLINNFELDLTTLSIGTDNPINYVRAQSFIIQDTGLTFQTGTPAQIIAKLEKNANVESVLTIDNLNVNMVAGVDSIDVNAAVVNTSLTSNGTTVFNSSTENKGAMIESKESVIVDLTNDGSNAVATITLTSTSRKNIFVKLKATTSPNLNPVYTTGAPGSITSNYPFVPKIILTIDFDANNPPAQNTAFTIYLVDVVEEFALTSILSIVNAEQISTVIRGGLNQSALPTPATIYLHNDLGSATYDIGINPTTANPQGSEVLKSYTFSKYGHNLSLLYILDENTNDRLLITGSVGLEMFP